MQTNSVILVFELANTPKGQRSEIGEISEISNFQSQITATGLTWSDLADLAMCHSGFGPLALPAPCQRTIPGAVLFWKSDGPNLSSVALA